jgi:hypothetical protein
MIRETSPRPPPPPRRTNSRYTLLGLGRPRAAVQLARLGLYEPAGVVVAEVKVYRRERDEQGPNDIPEIRRDKRPVRRRFVS